MIVAVDVGGTFTDVVAVDESGNLTVYKGPTTPRNPEEGVMRGLRRFEKVSSVLHATTIATNALLGQVGLELPKVALLTTKGFRDVIEIGRQNRPDLYDLKFRKPTPIVPRDMRFELDERTDADGRVLVPVLDDEVEKVLKKAKEAGATSVAVCFLHSYINSTNEEKVVKVARKYFTYVSASHEISPEPREYERTSTTVINAALQPIVSRYVEGLEKGLREVGSPRLFIMASSGGLVDSTEASERPVQVIESGPAAGVVGVSVLARTMGERNALSFDMGGTTAKAGTVVNFEVETTQEYEVGGRTHHGRVVKGSGYPIRFPFVDLAEVSAGGGTVIWRDDASALRVGPLSTGADPGPACYGKGGTSPTLTDGSLVMGWVPEQLAEGLKLRKDLAVSALRTLGEEVEVAFQASELASLEMARAMRLVTVERGLDPSSFTLFAFGGAGPQYALRLAEEMEVRKVVVPPHPGLFSALGVMSADRRLESAASYPRDLESAYRKLEGLLRSRFPEASKFLRYADVRYEGQGWELTVPVEDVSKVREVFEERHLKTYGFTLQREVEVVTVRVFAVAPGLRVSTRAPVLDREPSVKEREVFLDGWTKASVYRREELPEGFEVKGPAVVEEYSSTTVVRRGWRLTVHQTGALVMER
ncbi:5-oxoprolinase [Sulfodiicoccus acidiphilus]|uniref:5-oxoprolinase n=1 Tax=Sulfodiicoccus acidiphilus TaxID=1670455 RepID=A0A830H096_9CREN|nr:5-oxoprolinase [Sulfodiicoccus acidiphilus]